MSTMTGLAASVGRHSTVLSDYRRARVRVLGQAGIVLAAVLASAWYVNLLDFVTLANGVPAILTLARESFPPDFSSALSWWKPLIDTLAMSIAGTAVAVAISLPLGISWRRATRRRIRSCFRWHVSYSTPCDRCPN